MTSRRKRLRRLLLWNRWIAHYPPTIAAPPAAVRAFEAANRVEPYADEWYER